MKMSFGVAAIAALGVFFCWTNPSHALLCVNLNKTDGTGVAMKWAAMPIPYYVNDEKLPEGERAAALAAVQAAFLTYQELTCSSITFEDKGKTTDTGYINDAILIQWSEDAAMGGSAYFHKTPGTPDSEGMNIAYSGIQLNTKWFGVGKIADKFDIQTTMKYLIGAALGFYAGGGDPNVGNFTEIVFDLVDPALNQEQIDGARYIYYNDDGTGCTVVADPVPCHTVAPIVPEGVKDSGPNPTTDGGPNPTKDSAVSTADKGTSPTVDSGTVVTTPDDDDGCCRVSHARSASTPYLALVGLLILATLLRRRRR